MGWISRIALLLIVVVAGTALWVGWNLNGSLAPLEGEQTFAGLNAEVEVERDAQGIPTIHAENRQDAAFALGVLHAQERYFQMDLLRRNSAGEMSELLGADLLSHDSRVRTHQFRKRAERAVAALGPEEADILKAYTRGVNAGLGALDKAPFEYLLLQGEPKAWRPADTVLVLFSMYLDLQPEWNEHERSLAVMRDSLPADWYRFLTPAGGKWDSPIHGDDYQWQAALPEQPLSELQSAEKLTANGDFWSYRDGFEVGSNNWSVSGGLTEYGSGMVANDMHLGLNVPNIWYRASWYLNRDGRRVTGATLPGAPTLVVGSNEYIAWGFTNSYGDYHDSIILQVSEDGSRYLTPDGWEDFRVESEQIKVKGGDPVELEVRLTRWGPVIGKDHKGNALALRWVPHDVEGANLNSYYMEKADNIYQAMDVAATAGIPGQNLNVVDRQGNQAWTIMGRLPRRVGFDEAGIAPTEPADWSGGDIGWNGYLAPEEYPRVVNPADGRIWTANARIVSDHLLDLVGRGDYALGARQQQIETGLHARDQLKEQDFLDIALDDRAVFLERWRSLLLNTLGDTDQSELSELEGFVEDWEGRASKTSVGYLAVKAFREEVIDSTLGEVIRRIDEEHKAEGQNRVFWPSYVDARFEYPVWSLVSEQPQRHVPTGYESWPEFLSAMATETVKRLTANGSELAEQTWGQANMLAIQHPISQALPVLSTWLDMPSEPMAGDTYMPRVQRPSSGASERMIVSPGHEENGIFHMATGQSGHPLSPFYDRGHRDWVEGNPSPFLPGETKWTMVLKPDMAGH